MKTIAKLFFVITLLCLPVFAQRYTNNQQDISVTLPGPAEESNNPEFFLVRGFNPEHTVGAMVISSNKKYDPPQPGHEQEYWDAVLQNTTPSEATLTKCIYPYWHGHSTVLCSYTAVNSTNVHLSGRIWETIKNGFLYDVTSFSSDGTGYDDIPQKIVDSFYFPSEGGN